MDKYFQCNVQFTLPAFTWKSHGVHIALDHELCSFRRPLFWLCSDSVGTNEPNNFKFLKRNCKCRAVNSTADVAVK
jgi:hypothetical protein